MGFRLSILRSCDYMNYVPLIVCLWKGKPRYIMDYRKYHNILWQILYFRVDSSTSKHQNWLMLVFC